MNLLRLLRAVRLVLSIVANEQMRDVSLPLHLLSASTLLFLQSPFALQFESTPLALDRLRSSFPLSQFLF